MNSKTVVKLILLVACSVCSIGQLCPAQTPDQTPKYLLFRGRPLPYCKSYFIWETAFLLRLNRPAHNQFERGVQPAVTLDIGLMWNLSPVHGLGGVFHLGVASESSRIAALIRYRRWLSDRPAGSGSRPLRIDFDAGPVITEIDGNYSGYRALNLSTGIALNIEDYAGLLLRFETNRTSPYVEYDYGSPPRIIRTVPSRTFGTFYAGLRLGSYPGALTSVIGGGVLVTLMIALSGIGN